MMKTIASIFLQLGSLVLGSAIASFAQGAAAPSWVDSTLEALSLEEKAAQMIMVSTTGYPRNRRSQAALELTQAVRDHGVGGLVLLRSQAGTIPDLLNELQEQAQVPLLVAMDMERSLAFRLRRGSTSLPYAMAIGATGSEDAARFLGEVTAREARALGIHWAFAPVLDVNNNPDNPVINIRSFGENPQKVAALGSAFIRGAKGGQLLTTAKHFPGHGDTKVDSHLDLPVIAVDRGHLEAVEWPPFKAALAAGVDSVMVGHVALPALDASGQPATLSGALNEKILRREMGFQGLIVTDAMDMAGVASAWSGEATLRAVQAGADVVLMPHDLRVAIQSLVRGVREGQITEERIDRSVRRILQAKAALGLHQERFVDPRVGAREVGRPEDQERARRIAEASITLVRNDGNLLPLRVEDPLRILHLVTPRDLGFPEEEFAARKVTVETLQLAAEVVSERVEEIVAIALESTHILVSATFYEGPHSTSLRGLLQRLSDTGLPLIVASFRSPYLFSKLPDVSAYLCTFSPANVSRQAAVSALFGEIDVRGKLPVTLSKNYPAGWGLEIPRRAMSLVEAAADEVGFRPGGMAQVDGVLDQFLERGAFPGGVLAVGYRGKLVHLHPFGKLSYDEDSPAVSATTIYDLASLTKVIATTTMAMILVDEGRLDLDKKVQDFLPLFVGPGKASVTVRHLLTHTSGIDWWAPLFEEIQGPEAYLERIQAMELAYEPGTETKYSDLGVILLGEILARIAGQGLEDFVRQRVFEPLAMHDTIFRPGEDLRLRIAPTEFDARTQRVIHAHVHDENALALGGVAPHAGLFSTAGDVARFAQMLLYGGVFEHHRIVSRGTLERFTRKAGIPDSDRALGWDTKSPEHSSAGSLFSPRSFGHTGFTGTSIWVDPERQLFIVLLTNRVHPSRENHLIREVRPAVADAVVRALVED